MSQCTHTQQEWQNLADAITVVDGLINDSETSMLGRELLYDTRRRQVLYCLNEVGKCDELNAKDPIPKEQCPIYKILEAKLKQLNEDKL